MNGGTSGLIIILLEKKRLFGLSYGEDEPFYHLSHFCRTETCAQHVEEVRTKHVFRVLEYFTWESKYPRQRNIRFESRKLIQTIDAILFL